MGDAFIRRAANRIVSMPVFRRLNDDVYLKIKYRIMTGNRLDILSPINFSEKLQWLKLYDRNDKYTDMVDKIAVKQMAMAVMGSERVAKTLSVWDTADEIDISVLPNTFVLKCSHDSGSTVVCREKDDFDIEGVKKFFRVRMKKNYFYEGREWPYKNVRARVFAEEMLPSPDPMIDYKVFCFHGNPEYVVRYSQSATVKTMDFYDIDWNLLSVLKTGYSGGKEIERPSFLDEMLKYARSFSAGTMFLRVDFMDIGGKIYFGELTFYPSSGFLSFSPKDFDGILGGKLHLREI